ncbi:MAG: hypothetical protein ACYSWX_01680 [Planctomycetota bacterium]
MKLQRLALGAALMMAACATQAAVQHVAPPLLVQTSAFDAGISVALPEVEAEELPGLHHVYRLSDNIVSGAEPEGVEAFASMKTLGIRTVLSVDGKAPDHELAAEHGIRYVHVPIRYDGITDDELVAITKTFRELEGPFYVHCFHGQHRGPAAAAVGRIVLDGASREQALAEMRQWCGTSSKYEGLYGVAAFGALPNAATTATSDFDFSPEHRFDGLRSAMIDMTRSFDTIEDLMLRDWGVNPHHPDASAVNEAAKLLESFEQSLAFEDTLSRPSEFSQMLEDSRATAARLVEHLEARRAGDPEAGELAAQQVEALANQCSRCHASYRNN